MILLESADKQWNRIHPNTATEEVDEDPNLRFANKQLIKFKFKHFYDLMLISSGNRRPGLEYAKIEKKL